MAEKFRGLGKGLTSLFGDFTPANNEEVKVISNVTEKVLIHLINPNPYQPRKDFNENLLAELAESIKQQGIIQPILVRKKGPENYEIIAGERRWRAAQLAKVHEVPVVVINLDDKKTLEFALLENIQRSDLNGLEEAMGYENLIKVHSYSQETLSKILGKSRSHIANTLRLTTLPDEIKKMISEGLLTAGHGRALVNIPNNIKLAKTIIEKNLSVRQAEFLVKKEPIFGSKKDKLSKDLNKESNTRSLENELSLQMGISVEINNKKNNSGDIKFSYKNSDQLNKIISVLKRHFG
jgi:ParB family chromosome partitioning protein